MLTLFPWFYFMVENNDRGATSWPLNNVPSSNLHRAKGGKYQTNQGNNNETNAKRTITPMWEEQQ